MIVVARGDKEIIFWNKERVEYSLRYGRKQMVQTNKQTNIKQSNEQMNNLARKGKIENCLKVIMEDWERKERKE